jgi:SAM-dependent methyltransferase
MGDRRRHWDGVYASKRSTEVGWFEATPTVSLALVTANATPSSSVLDVGAGASSLVDELVRAGFADLTVLDVSPTALEEVRARLGNAAHNVCFVTEDVLTWNPSRTFDVWHDRAVFHFLTDQEERQQYVNTVLGTLSEKGALVIATFAEDGPETCSGLPVTRSSPAALAEAFPALRLTHSERVEHRTPSGAVQPFTYAVFTR